MSMDAMPESRTDAQSCTTISQLIVLPVDQIQPFTRNPRRTPNPARDRIKASIRAHGLDHALAVTRPPGAVQYLLTAGGGTRLEVLRELYAETNESRFGRVPCVLTPWPGEAEVLLAHVRENDLRGELSFIEKARAVIECKALLESESGESLSQQALSEALMRRGYGLSQSMISAMTYAVERLLPVIPIALERGLGRPQVQRIRHLDRSACRLWLSCGLETHLSYDEVFLTLCRRYDGPDWSFDDLEEAMAVEVAEGADRRIQSVRLELRSTAGAQGSCASKIEQRAAPGINSLDSEAASVDASAERAYSRGFNDPLPREENSSLGTYAEEAQSALLPASSGAIRPGNHPLKSARARSWALALRLAKRFGLAELIVSVPKEGLGYLLIDMPDAGLLSQTTAEEGDQIREIWRHLAQCCEVAVAPRERLLVYLSEHSLLFQRLQKGDLALDGSSLHFLNQSAGGALWRAMDDKAWRDYVGLMDAYRSAHALAENLNIALWSEQ